MKWGIRNNIANCLCKLSGFGEQEVAHKSKSTSIGHVPTLLLNKNI
jgi:hypothetical protein